MIHRKRTGAQFVAVLAIIVMLGIGFPRHQALAAGSWVTGTTSTQWGSRDWKLYVPSGYRAGTAVPLVMMLHGCTQNADSFDAGTQMSGQAEQSTFLVIYPIQPSSVDANNCWQWWSASHQSRGSGEPAILKAMVDQAKANYAVDGNRVYVAGMSAGAAMTAIMAATYTDVFAAAAVNSGLEYKAATTDTSAAWSAMRTGGPDPKTQGKLAYQASGTAHRVVPTIVFQGKSDYTVYPVNGDQVLSQAMWMDDWADDGQNNASINDTPTQTINGQVSGGYAYTTYRYADHQGNPIGEKWLIDQMGHAWSGGSTAGSYTDPKGPKATQEIWRFFSQFPATPPTPPGPVISANPGPTTYGSPLSVTLSSDTAGTAIYYTTDGTLPSTSSPIYTSSITISTTTTVKAMGVANGVQGGVSSFVYQIAAMVITATPPGGTYGGGTAVTLVMNMPGTIYYTTDGSTPTTSSPVYTSPISLSCSNCPQTYVLHWLGQDKAGHTGGSGSASYTISQPPQQTTVSFFSRATEDGYIYAPGQGLPNSMLSYLEMGDTGMNAGEYALTSFDTSSLPDSATIDSASLTLIHYGNTYFNATGLGPIVVDIKAGCFNNNCSVESADYSAAADAVAVITIVNIPIQDQQTAYGDVSASGMPYVNRTGTTQLRLRFQNITNNNYSLDALRFYSGENTNSALKPVLKVTYH